MSVEIKLLSTADLPLLLRADTDVFDNPIDPELARAYLEHPDYLIALALDRDRVVGMAGGLFYFFPDKPLEFFVNEVGVAASHHRQGIGKKLMARLLDAARARGVRYAWVGTETDNLPALALYRSLEGKEVEAIYFEFED